MASFTTINACRICSASALEPVLSLGDQYLTGVFPADDKTPLTCGPLELVRCADEEGCGLVQLRHSYQSAEIYGDNYGYRSSLNRSMVRHLEGKVAALRARIDLQPGDLVLDIGSNDGTLLSFYPENLRLVGMDPTSALFRQYYRAGIRVITDFFSRERFRKEVGPEPVKIITSIAMFYDLESPKTFVEDIAALLDQEGLWHFEQSYLPLMLSQNAYDTICHEHLEYYGLRQIKWLLDRCGLKIVAVELNDINGGSFAITAAHRDSRHPEASETVAKLLHEEEGSANPSALAAFRDRVFRHRDDLLRTLGKLRQKGAKVFGYGASTKGNVILQFCGITAEQLPCIAEVNSAKFGRRTPGSNIPIVSEEEAHAQRPDYFLVLPWHFRKNLLEREAAFLKAGGKMLFPLPEIEVFPA
jgi:hypothetical protein